MNRLLALTWKEFLQLKRDRMTLRMIVMVPIMQTLIFGYAINYDVKHLKTVVLDESRSYESRELVAKMTAHRLLPARGPRRFAGRDADARSTPRARIGGAGDRPRLRQGPASRRARPGLPDRERLRHDHVVAGHVDHVRASPRRLSIRTLAQRAGWTHRQLPIDLRVRPWYNPDLRTSRFIIPGLIAIILTFTLIQFTASAIVRERERGTLEQLQVTPATRAELILGKILPFIVIGYFQFTMTVLLMRFLFQIPIMGSVLELYLVGFLFMAAVLGLGMLISTIAQTQMQASQMSMFFLLPVRVPVAATSSRSTACR